jgi:hypothetical protein
MSELYKSNLKFTAELKPSSKGYMIDYWYNLVKDIDWKNRSRTLFKFGFR